MTLLEWRKSQGLSQREAGEKCGWDQARWSRYESRTQEPKGAALRTLVQVTNGAVTLAELLTAPAPTSGEN